MFRTVLTLFRLSGQSVDWYVQGRQSFRRIVIANSDAGAEATVDMAIVQAHRAVQELG